MAITRSWSSTAASRSPTSPPSSKHRARKATPAPTSPYACPDAWARTSGSPTASSPRPPRNPGSSPGCPHAKRRHSAAARAATSSLPSSKVAQPPNADAPSSTRPDGPTQPPLAPGWVICCGGNCTDDALTTSAARRRHSGGDVTALVKAHSPDRTTARAQSGRWHAVGGDDVRFEELSLRIPGDELRMRFHKRITVLSGLEGAERLGLVDSLLDTVADGPSGQTVLSYRDAQGRRVTISRDVDGAITHSYDDGSS